MRASILVVASVLAFPKIAPAQFGAGWLKTPRIVVIGPADDPRQPLVDEAVTFWNKTLAELGLGFRLGIVTRHVGSVPGGELQRMSNLVVEASRRPNLVLPDAIVTFPVIFSWCSAMRGSFHSRDLLSPTIAGWSQSAG